MATDRRVVAGLRALILAVLALAMSPPTALGSSPQLTRYPYLTDIAGTHATLNWATDRSSAVARLTWGAVGSETCTARAKSASKTSISVGSTPEYQWKARLSGLQPDTSYCYRVYLGPTGSDTDLLGSDSSPQFVTHPAPGAPTSFKFAVLGDWGYTTSQGNVYQAAVLDQLAASGARLALSTGDMAYNSGTQTNYGDLFQTGAEVSTVFGPDFWTVAGSSIPMYPALGNHGRNATFPLVWPQASVVANSGGRYQMETYCCLNGTSSKSYPSAWYAFDVGSARFYVLDATWSSSNVGTADEYANDYDYHWAPDRPEYQWLEHDLGTHPSAVKFAFFHYPLYSANATETSDTYLRGSASLEGLLSRYGVDIAFNGHAHIYQRNNPSDPSGLISYVTGGGGGKLQPVTKCAAVANVVAYAIGWSNSSSKGSSCGAAGKPTSIDQVYHYLLVSVDGNSVTVTPTDSAGRTFDVQTFTFPDTDPPVTRITKGAPMRTDKHKVKFKFTSNERNSTFECKIHKKPFKPCEPPKTVRRLREGKHKFKVRAVDPAGNVDPSPAKDKFRVVD